MPIDHYPSSSEVREVGPRDGLQNEDPIPVGARIDLVDALSETGLRAIEVGSFVRPDAIPAMAGTDRVLAAITRREGVRYRVLVPNLRGAELAVDAGADELEVVVSVSDTHNARNLKMSVDDSVEQIRRVVERAAVGGRSRRGHPRDVVRVSLRGSCGPGRAWWRSPSSCARPA